MMRHYTINFKDIYTKGALHDLLSEQLELPEYYGRNLDALMDCLTDMREDTEIEMIGLSSLMDNLMEYAGNMLTVFHRAAFENKHLTLIFREEH